LLLALLLLIIRVAVVCLAATHVSADQQGPLQGALSQRDYSRGRADHSADNCKQTAPAGTDWQAVIMLTLGLHWST